MFADQDSFALLRKAGEAVADTKFIYLISEIKLQGGLHGPPFCMKNLPVGILRI